MITYNIYSFSWFYYSNYLCRYIAKTRLGSLVKGKESVDFDMLDNHGKWLKSLKQHCELAQLMHNVNAAKASAALKVDKGSPPADWGVASAPDKADNANPSINTKNSELQHENPPMPQAAGGGGFVGAFHPRSLDSGECCPIRPVSEDVNGAGNDKYLT